MTGWVGLGILWRLPCVCFTLTCKQKESSLELSSLDWPQMTLSLAYTAPACNWCTLDLLGLKLACFFWQHTLVKCPNLWHALHWNFDTLNICPCFDGYSWHQITSCDGFAPGNFHIHAACDLIVWILQITSFSCIFLLVILCIGAWEDQLCFLWITRNLLDMVSSGFGTFHHFCKLSHSAC